LIHVHILTGFLGVGKTTTLKHLISQKPHDEKWAVLLNEFGKTGLDSDLLTSNVLSSSESSSEDVHISQVAGGCLCCVTPLLFQTALNKIIRFEKPTRIFIEPSGLGHPDKIIELLKEPQYQNILNIGAVLTLIDARHLLNSRYRKHEIYARQLAVADVFVANKIKLASTEDLAAFDELLKKYQRPGIHVNDGQVPMEYWQKTTQQNTIKKSTRMLFNKIGGGDEFFTHTMLFDVTSPLNIKNVTRYLSHLKLIRVKGLLPSKGGAILINGVNQEISVQPSVSDSKDYRLEIICDAAVDVASIKAKISACIDE
jgi:G3E family GTPase